MKKISIVISIIVVALIAGGVWFWQSGNLNLGMGSSNEGEVVAMIGEEEITRGEFDAYMTQLAANFDVTIPDESLTEERAEFERTALDQMINERLFASGAAGSGVTVSDADVDARLAEIIAQFETEAEYQAELQTAGLSEDQLRQNIREQLVIEGYFAQLTQGQDFSVPDAEVEAFYAEQFDAEAEVSFEEVSEQIRSFLEDGRRQAALDAAIQNLRDSANVQVLL